MALSVSPILGFTGVASAADPLPPVADPIGDGNFCEGAPSTEPFTDVTPADPSLDEIICLVATGITQGTTATTYSPNGTVTRRQMAMFIKRVADLANELELVELTDLPAYDGSVDFDDVEDEDADFQEAIGQLVQAGIVEGVTADEFRPGAPVSRRQMAAFVNRLQEFLSGTPFSDDGDYFDDDNGDTGEDNLNALASVGIFQGDGAGNVFPGSALTRRQMANILLRHLQVNFAAGAIDGAFDVTPESLITVDPSGPAILEVSGTPGTPTGENALREYTVTVDDAACDAIDVALIPYQNLTMNADGTVTFADVDGMANRADGLGGTAARIETVNGVNPFFPNPATDGQDYVSDVDVPANGEVTVTVNSQTANQAVVLVAFCDDDNNNQLNLTTDTDLATEEFGLGGVQLITPPEADDLQNGTDMVILTLDILDFFTSQTDTFWYDSSDDFDYDSGGNAWNLSMDEFEAYLSGVETGQIDDPDTNSGARGAGTVFGDIVNYGYRNDPAGESFFSIWHDVPGAVQNVAAEVTDVDSDGAPEVSVTWDELANPDVAGYDVFVQEVINDIPTGDWQRANLNLITGTSYTGELGVTFPFDPNEFDAGDTFQFVVLGLNDETFFYGQESYGPDSNIVQLDIPASSVTLPPVSNEVFVFDDNGNFIIENGDGFRAEFNQPVALAANASFTVKDLNDGEFSTLTCGTNAICAVGPADTIEVQFTANPVVNGPVGENDQLDTPIAVEAATGLTGVDGGLAWHLPASAINGITEGAAEVVFNLPDDPDAVFDGDNGDLPVEIDVFDISAEDDSAVLSIADGLVGGSSDIEQGDPVHVYDAAGTLLGSSTYDDTVGAQVNIGVLPAETPLVVQYVDRDWATGTNGDDVRSAATLVFVAGDAPTIAPGGIQMIDSNTLEITWVVPNPPLTQVKPPSAYTIHDEDNTDLVATGTTVTVINATTVQVDFDANIVPGTDYYLRVQAATVQNNNNVPNEAQADPFTAALPVNIVPTIVISGGPADNAVLTTNTPAFNGSAADVDGNVMDVEYQIRRNGAVTTSWTSIGAANISGEGTPAANWSFSVPALPESVDTNDDFEVEFRSVDDDSDVSTVAERVNLRVNTTTPTVTAANVVSDGLGGATDYIELTFDESVSCTNTVGSRTAFTYDDQTAADNDNVPADTTYSSIGQLAGNQCSLVPTSSMDLEDFGPVSYTQPVAPGDRLVDAFGTALPSFGPVTANDQTTPTVSSIAINFATDTVTVTMSENIACSELGTADFTVTVGAAPVGVASVANCAGAADSVFDLVLAQDVVAGTVVATRTANTLHNEQHTLNATGSASV